MSERNVDVEQLRKEITYYKRQADELTGENIRLDTAISGLRHELQQRRQGFALLSQLQQSIGAYKEVASIFEITLRAINGTLGMDKTVVLTPTEEENGYRPSQWLGFRPEDASTLSSLRFTFPPEFAEGTGLFVVTRSAEPTPLVKEIRDAFDLPYFICLPIMVEGAPIGLLLSGRLGEMGPFVLALNQGDVDTFQAIAGLISASVQNMRVTILEEMDRLKTEFFANVSHEFRTPITLTLGPLEQLLKGRYGEVPESMDEQLRAIQRNQARLLALVNQILDLAKLEAGSMQLQAGPVPDLNRFIEERLRPFRAAAESRGLELRRSMDEQVSRADVFIDREKFERLLLNLLSNALKFTKQGHVEVSTEILGNEFCLAVSDTGIGIKQDQLPHIFDRFRQADGSESREHAGTGLGLALVKEVARLHGGEVTVRSQYGEGSMFRVSIPLGKDHLDPASVVEFEDLASSGDLQQEVMAISEEATGSEDADQANRATEVAFDPAKPTILYVEDNPDLRKHVRDLLAVDYNAFLAVDGHDGLAKAREYRPDLILTDQMMPRMSGRGLLQEIREDPELRSTPVVFLTARAGTESRIESLDAGADDYLTKPFDEAELLVRVRNLLRARAQERALEALNRQIQEANRAKSEFLANMSHELRTPMNAVLGFTEMILDGIYGDVPEEIYGVMTEIDRSGRLLLDLINDVLDLSKIEAGEMELHPTECTPTACVQDAILSIEVLAQQKGLTLLSEVVEGIPSFVADEMRIGQVLRNLLSNAVKFTEEGEIGVGARVEGEDVLFWVRDMGMGIPEESLGSIFEAFHQVEGTMAREQQGTGLGLSLCQRFVGMHEGRIWVESVVGQGSTFWFTIPMES